MTATTAPVPAPAEEPASSSAATRPRSVPRSGWMVIGAKEFGDHLLSARFVVLVIVLGLAAAIPLYFAAASIRDGAAIAASGSTASAASPTPRPASGWRAASSTG